MRRSTRVQQIADKIEQRIADGEFKPGEKLPTQRAFVLEYSMSSRDVSTVMEVLQARQIVVTQRGKGTYVK